MNRDMVHIKNTVKIAMTIKVFLRDLQKKIKCDSGYHPKIEISI